MIARKLENELVNHLDKKEISLIVGPRQAGKTTLMLWLQEHLRAKGERTLFLNLDVDYHKPYFDSQQSLISKIKLELGEGQWGGFHR